MTEGGKQEDIIDLTNRPYIEKDGVVEFDKTESEKVLGKINLTEFIKEKHLLGKKLVKFKQYERGDFGSQLEKSDYHQKSERELQDIIGRCKSEKDLENIGLGIEISESDIFGSNEDDKYETISLSVSFYVTDGNKFIDYLKILNKNNLERDKLENLKEIIKDLYYQIRLYYDISDSDNGAMIELMGHLGEIAESCSKVHEKNEFGDTKSIHALEMLKKYSQVNKEKYLKEYLLVDKLFGLEERSLLQEIYFDTRMIEMDIEDGSELFKERIEKAINAIVQIGRNSYAHALKQEIINKLKSELIHDVRGWVKSELSTKTDAELYNTLIDQTIKRLEELEKNN